LMNGVQSLNTDMRFMNVKNRRQPFKKH